MQPSTLFLLLKLLAPVHSTGLSFWILSFLFGPLRSLSLPSLGLCSAWALGPLASKFIPVLGSRPTGPQSMPFIILGMLGAIRLPLWVLMDLQTTFHRPTQTTGLCPSTWFPPGTGPSLACLLPPGPPPQAPHQIEAKIQGLLAIIKLPNPQLLLLLSPSLACSQSGCQPQAPLQNSSLFSLQGQTTWPSSGPGLSTSGPAHFQSGDLPKLPAGAF